MLWLFCRRCAGMFKSPVIVALCPYPDIFALFDEAFDVSVQEYCEARRAAVEQVSDPRERLRACIASGVPRAKHQIDTTRLLIELHPYVLRDPAQLERWHAYCAEQTAIYRAVLEQGAAEQVFVLADTAERIGEDFIALEDGHSGSVIAGNADGRLCRRAPMGLCQVHVRHHLTHPPRPSPDPTTRVKPVVRWASSQITKSKVSTPCRWASAAVGRDW